MLRPEERLYHDIGPPSWGQGRQADQYYRDWKESLFEDTGIELVNEDEVHGNENETCIAT